LRLPSWPKADYPRREDIAAGRPVIDDHRAADAELPVSTILVAFSLVVIGQDHLADVSGRSSVFGAALKGVAA